MNFILLIIIATLSISLNAVMEKDTVDKYGYKTHCAVKFFATGLLLTLFTNFYIELSGLSIFYITLALLAQLVSVTIFIFFLSKTQVHALHVLIKVNIIISLVIDILIGKINFNILFIIYAIIFFAGLIIVCDVKNLKLHNLNNNIIIIFIILIVTNLSVPYFIQICLNNDYINNETMVILKSFIISLFAILFLKPNVIFSKNLAIDYIKQSVVDSIGNLSLNLIAMYSAFYFISTKTISTILIAFMSTVFLKTKISKAQYIGVVLASLGFMLLSLAKV